MTQLDHKYSLFENVLGTSQKLIKHLEQADKWDRTCMLFSLGFLGLVVLWIIWRRLLKAPILFFLAILRILPFSRNPTSAMEIIEKTTLDGPTGLADL